jgi:hypothetical protein
MSNKRKSVLLDEPCVCGKTDDKCKCPLGFFSPEDPVETNPPNQKCYCEVALGGGYDGDLGEWRPDDPEVFQRVLIKKIYSALRRDWVEGADGNLSLEMVVCPAEALWIAKALKANIHKKSKR